MKHSIYENLFYNLKYLFNNVLSIFLQILFEVPTIPDSILYKTIHLLDLCLHFGPKTFPNLVSSILSLYLNVIWIVKGCRHTHSLGYSCFYNPFQLFPMEQLYISYLQISDSSSYQFLSNAYMLYWNGALYTSICRLAKEKMDAFHQYFQRLHTGVIFHS